MSPDKSSADAPQPSPFCPQCGSDDTASIPHDPQAKGGEPPNAKEQGWYRCQTCRHKWREES